MTMLSAAPAARAAEPIAEPKLLHHIHDLARDDGLIAGLRALTEELAPDGVPFGPSGHAVVPSGTSAAGHARRLLTITVDGDAVHAVLATVFGPAPATWLIGVSWLRLGASRQLLRHATDHVTGRTAGNERLIQLQMVKGVIAEALTEQLEAEALLEGHTDLAVLVEANARIQAADRMLLRLLGASGFQAGLPSHTCWVSELLADAYLGYDTTDGAS